MTRPSIAMTGVTLLATVICASGASAEMGPCATVIEPPVRALTENTRDVGFSTLVFAAHPAMTINDQGLFQAAVHTRGEATTDGLTYDVTVQVTRSGQFTCRKCHVGHAARRRVYFDHCALV